MSASLSVSEENGELLLSFGVALEACYVRYSLSMTFGDLEISGVRDYWNSRPCNTGNRISMRNVWATRISEVRRRGLRR
jgi:hypothetical protein